MGHHNNRRRYSDGEAARAPLSPSESDPLPFLDPTKKAWILAAAANDVRHGRWGWLSVKMKSTNFVLMLLMKQNIVVRLMPSCWPAGWKASRTSSERSVPPHSVRPLLGLHSDALGSEGDFHSHVDFDDLDYCFMIIAAVSVTIAKMFSTTMFPPSPCWWSTLSCCPLDNRSPLM